VNTILIIDDDPRFRAQARSVLESDGFTVIGEAIDASSGLVAAWSLRPNFVLLDIGLPDSDGIKAAEALALSGSPSLVVLTSSREASVYGPRLTRSRCIGFIPKEQLSGRAIRALVDRA
jgi:DNA-binding NarL/FixJ family response regulator